MRFDLHLRATVLEDLQTIAGEMRTWQAQAKVGEAETEQIRQQVGSFAHCTIRTGLRVAGVDDSGDFPMLSYADSFVYLSVAQGTVYGVDRLADLKQVSLIPTLLIQFDWILESEKTGRAALLKAFERLVGRCGTPILGLLPPMFRVKQLLPRGILMLLLPVLPQKQQP